MKIRDVMAVCFFLFFLSACGSDISDSVGAACTHTDDCAPSARCLTGDDYPGGFCSPSCNHSGECPGGTECIKKSGGVCLFKCKNDRDCPSDWECEKEKLEENNDTKVRVCLGD